MKNANKNIVQYLQRISTAKSKERPGSRLHPEPEIQEVETPERGIIGSLRSFGGKLLSSIERKLANTNRIIDTHVGEDTDEFLDVTNIRPWALHQAAAGTRVNLLTIQVPASQRLVIQQYKVFAVLYEGQMIITPTFAHPLEFILATGTPVAIFELNINGQSAFDHRFADLTAGANVFYKGLEILSDENDISENPTSSGLHIVVPGGTTFTVDAVKIGVGLPPRQVAHVGTRIRGFFTNKYVGKAEAKEREFL